MMEMCVHAFLTVRVLRDQRHERHRELLVRPAGTAT